MLNPAKRSYREKFNEVIEDKLNAYQLEDELSEMTVAMTYHKIEVMDTIITRIINEAIKKVEGMKRNILFLHIKKKY